MISLIDGDLISFRCAASAEEEPESIALLRTDKLIRDILEATKAESYQCFLTGSNNFRKEINPEYKANRKDKPLPKHLNACREFLVVEWKSKVTDGIEADDALGIQQELYNRVNHSMLLENQLVGCKQTVICSLDKDLLQIPGMHYQWPIYNREGMFHNVLYLDGLKHFYKQMLIGDVSDNIKGVDGIGKVKASKLVDNCETEEEMMEIVCGLYKDPDRFQINADCLWIMRNENEQWSDRCNRNQRYRRNN